MSDSKASSVLIIMYYWPPAGGPGVQRWLKLTKYLAELDLDIYVLTVDPAKATYPLRDESLLNDVHPKVTVVRTDTSEGFNLYKKVTRKKEVPFSGFANESEKVSLVQRIARFVRGNFFVPDARKGWNKHAYRAAEKLIAEHNIQTVITSSPPHSTQLLGYKLKKNLGIHWITDFRDPWTDIYYYRLFYPTRLTRWYESRLERKVLTHADDILSVSWQWGKLYASKDLSINEDRIHILPNGYDQADFEGLEKSTQKVFTITYAGTITQQYPLDAFKKAIAKLPFPVRLRMIGRWDEGTKTSLSALPNHIEVEWIPYMPKSELNAELVNADLLLFILPVIESSTGHLPGKIFDYLGSGNPILGYGGGDAKRVLMETESGKMFDYEEVEAVAQYIQDIQAERFVADRQKRRVFERSNQAQQLSEMLSNMNVN